MDGSQSGLPVDLVRIRYVDGEDREHWVRLEQAADLAVEDGRMVRKIPSHRGQAHTPGRYWSATTGGLIEYESHLESKWLTMLDFDRAVVAIVAQPLEFEGVDDAGQWSHVPDVFARRDDGSAWLLDVKNPSQMDRPKVRLQAARTSRACQRLHWDYEMVGDLPAQRWANISWLSGYRRPPHLGVDLVPRLVGLAREPVAIGDLIGFVEYPDLARAVLFHLCWRQEIVFDLDAPLRETTKVSARTWTR